MSEKILVTGGLGYIGSHVVVALAGAGYEPIIVDNLSNARASVLERLERLTQKTLTHYDVDIRNRAAMETVLEREPCVGLIHLAAFKAVGESVEAPLKYYDNNVTGSVALFDVFEQAGGGGIVFSSSAMVYGDVKVFPLHEGMPVQPKKAQRTAPRHGGEEQGRRQRRDGWTRTRYRTTSSGQCSEAASESG